MQGFGKRIREARESAGFTQEQLAELLDVSRTAVSRWEQGDNEPTLDHLKAMACLLHISCDSLLGLPHRQTFDISPDAQQAMNRFIEILIREKSL